MSLFKVHYQSMIAHYGPSYIEAEDELAARRKFAGTAFGKGELSLIHAEPITAEQMAKEIRRSIQEEEP